MAGLAKEIAAEDSNISDKLITHIVLERSNRMRSHQKQLKVR